MEIEISLEGIIGKLGVGFVDSSRLRADVKNLYEKYSKSRPSVYNRLRRPDDLEYEGERKFYVYEWYTKDKGKVFYVGKGTGKRYNHILSEMSCDGFRERMYLELQDAFCIDYRIVADKLTNLEADIYEKCWMRERIAQGEVLLNFADMPRGTHEAEYESYCARNFTPLVKISDYKRRYFDITEVMSYDTIQIKSLLSTAFIGSGCDIFAGHEKEMITNYVESCGGRVYKSVAKSANSVIEFCNIDYDLFKELKGKGYAVYHSFHVIDFIKATPPVIKEGAMPLKIKVPKFDSNKRDAMREYLKESEDEINKIIKESVGGLEPERKGLQFKALNNFEEAIKYFEASVRMKFFAPATYLHLAIIYRRLGMFEEELDTLEHGIAAVDPRNSYELTERLRNVKSILRESGFAL